jgi:hypothetical protein
LPDTGATGLQNLLDSFNGKTPANLVGLYERLDVVATVVRRESGEAVIQYVNEGDEIVAERRVVEE